MVALINHSVQSQKTALALKQTGLIPYKIATYQTE